MFIRAGTWTAPEFTEAIQKGPGCAGKIEKEGYGTLEAGGPGVKVTLGYI